MLLFIYLKKFVMLHGYIDLTYHFTVLIVSTGNQWLNQSCINNGDKKDDDNCLQSNSGWRSYTCKRSTYYCKSYQKIMEDCCPETCGYPSRELTEEDCLLAQGTGKCNEPRYAKCCLGCQSMKQIIF